MFSWAGRDFSKLNFSTISWEMQCSGVQAKAKSLFIWACDILYDSTIDGAAEFIPFAKELLLLGVRVNNLVAYRQC